MAKKKKSVQKLQHKEPEIEVRADNCQLFFGDTVNVAMRSDMVAFTLYHTVPDPLSDTPKRAVRYAEAIFQIPISVAVQLPSLIINQLLDQAELESEDLQTVIEQTKQILHAFETKLEEQHDAAQA